MTTIADDTAPSATLERVERVVAVIDRILGALIIALGILLLIGWSAGRQAGHDGMLFLWLGAQAIGPVGSFLLVAARAMKTRSRMRWVWQLVPLVYPILFFTVAEFLF
jgi:hypothetical protein